jgi:D-alanyl-D-alanine carboxypeptidase (penicillin-binding protein 5/6)
MLDDRVPPVSAASLLLVDLDSGRELWASNADVRRPPASLTKLMTALLLLESGRDLAQVVTVSPRAASTPGSTMGLSPGARLRLSDLLTGMLLPSGNDAAEAVAEAVDGSVDRFVAHMNSRAVQLGLQATHFVRPDGLDATGQLSSASDLLKIARQDLSYPRFNAVVQMRTATITAPDGTVYHLANLNQLLGVYPGADGVKTGTTPAAGENLVASVTRNGHRVLAAILGSSDRYADAHALLDYGWAHWSWMAPALPPFATLDVPRTTAGGTQVPLILPSTVFAPVPSWSASSLSLRISFDVSSEEGSYLNLSRSVVRAAWYLHGDEVFNQPIYLSGP